nr:thrombospondin type 3 repeat-containing protein [Candidatus Nitrosocosmicus oleophilus]
MGDACDNDNSDFDKDGIFDSKDNCFEKPNSDQKD